MKKILITLFTCIILVELKAQTPTQVQVLVNNDKEIVLDFHTGSYKFNSVKTLKGIEQVIEIKDAAPTLILGAPDLPHFSYALKTPFNTISKISILESEYHELSQIKIAPSKGKITRDIQPSDIPYSYGSWYNENSFYPTAITTLQQPYVFRDIQGQSVQIYPFQYNPINQLLKVYSHLKIKIEFINQPNQEQGNNYPTSLVEDFNDIYQNHFINYNKKLRYSPVIEQGNMLILSPSNYLSELEPFIKWKEMKGIKSILVNLDTLTGGVNENNIQNLAKYYYQNNDKIAYLLLVGDNTQIPSRNENYSNPGLAGPSDIGYAYISNNDHFPEFMVGRFSGETKAEIATQVKRSIDYEKFPNLSNAWITKQLGIASAEGPGDDNQMDFEHIGEIVDSNQQMNLFQTSLELFDDDGSTANGTYDQIGDPDYLMLSNAVNNGVSLINYAGHGSPWGLVTTQFSNTEVPFLTNTNKLPFIFVVGCSPGQFSGQTSFSESLQRLETAGNPQGTISNFMSTINQYWDAPMEAQDEFNGILRGSRPTNLKQRLGAICVDACAAMNNKYDIFSDPTGGSDMTDTWVYFGDPSISLATKNEGAITCTHTAEIGRHSTWYSVNCNVNGATIGLYYQGRFLASSTVIGGQAIFGFSDLQNIDTVFITATKANYLPYMGFAKVVDFPSSTGDQHLENSISVYPNPSADLLMIHLPKNLKVNSFTVVDMSGRLVHKQIVHNEEIIQMNIKEFIPGNYMLIVDSQDGNLSKSFTKN